MIGDETDGYVRAEGTTDVLQRRSHRSSVSPRRQLLARFFCEWSWVIAAYAALRGLTVEESKVIVVPFKIDFVFSPNSQP